MPVQREKIKTSRVGHYVVRSTPKTTLFINFRIISYSNHARVFASWVAMPVKVRSTTRKRWSLKASRHGVQARTWSRDFSMPTPKRRPCSTRNSNKQTTNYILGDDQENTGSSFFSSLSLSLFSISLFSLKLEMKFLYLCLVCCSF